MKSKPINVLSLFDGISAGQVALQKAGIKVNKYYASEIDKFAIQITQKNFPNTIQIGNVEHVTRESITESIDLIIGGSPCQGFSLAGKRLAFDDPRSKLFFEFVRIVNEFKPKFWLLENVMMAKEHQNIITQYLGIEPVVINSSLVSAQNRKRLYWTNIKIIQSDLFGNMRVNIPQPQDRNIFLKDILEANTNVDEKYFLTDKMISWLLKHAKKRNRRVDIKNIDESEKAKCLTCAISKLNLSNDYVVFSTQPRTGNPKKGGTGLLSRNDGKTYCLDTGNSNAIQLGGGEDSED
ncbi:MAG: DNA cytosine methyltransferase [Raineya sp.]|jgi:DNA (cytosine-5)-methyltransferase 3A|nr:DNA cytosine methyltransferase [Raineya sp.]